MLASKGIIAKTDCMPSDGGLQRFRARSRGTFPFRREFEDIISMSKPASGIDRGMRPGGFHTARSRNDQVATICDSGTGGLRARDSGLLALQRALGNRRRTIPRLNHARVHAYAAGKPVTFVIIVLPMVEMGAATAGVSPSRRNG